MTHYYLIPKASRAEWAMENHPEIEKMLGRAGTKIGSGEETGMRFHS